MREPKPNESSRAEHLGKPATTQDPSSRISRAPKPGQPSSNKKPEAEAAKNQTVECGRPEENPSPHGALIIAKLNTPSVAPIVRKSARLKAKRSSSTEPRHSEGKPVSAIAQERPRAKRSTTMRRPRGKLSQPSAQQENKSAAKSKPSRGTMPGRQESEGPCVGSKTEAKKMREPDKPDTKKTRKKQKHAHLASNEGRECLTRPHTSGPINGSAREGTSTPSCNLPIEEKNGNPFASLVSPITSQETGGSRKRCQKESPTCRSSSSEEEVKITRRTKRARTTDSASQLRTSLSTRESEHFTIATQHPVQSLTFEELADSHIAMKEALSNAKAVTELSSTTKACDPLTSSGTAWPSAVVQERGTADHVISVPSTGSSRKMKTTWDVDSDNEAETEAPTAVEGRAYDARDANRGALESIERGFEMFLSRMGGEPQEKDLRLLIKALGGKDVLDQEDDKQEPEQANELYKEVCDRDLAEHSPVLEDDDGLAVADGNGNDHDEWGDPVKKDLLSQYLQSQPAGNTGNSRSKREAAFDALQTPVPSQAIVVEQVLATELFVPERAGSLPKAVGHHADDELCESTIDVTEWILGAENLIGRNGLV
ncbi:hypothetical protein FGB62_425g04 [Gracilaria domingensis]|nr:hypothetical protein FGB62_425g04 [Gracilaria domingensis]